MLVVSILAAMNKIKTKTCLVINLQIAIGITVFVFSYKIHNYIILAYIRLMESFIKFIKKFRKTIISRSKNKLCIVYANCSFP